MPLLRVPYTDPLPPPRIIPATANTASGAIAALVDFLSPGLSSSPSSHVRRGRSTTPLSAPNRANGTTTTSTSSISSGSSSRSGSGNGNGNGKTVLLTGAGISVASGLADYRGANGTYTLNRAYRPIYFNEFCESHEARKRYWARSFLGWTNLERAKPNAAHWAVGRLGELGVVERCITQNVDSFHPTAHPHLPTTELHGYLRALVCLTCHNEYPRSAFQAQLSSLNPAWAAFLDEILASGALDTENPTERRKRGLKTNPDGDVDIPDAPYSTFRYPACPVCLERGEEVGVDKDGGWVPGADAAAAEKGSAGKGKGVLKPAVVMFGESIPAETKVAAERAIDAADRVLVVGSSLATYSAWRLVKRAKERGMPVGVLNLGGVRGEDVFFGDVEGHNTGRGAVRVSESADVVLPKVVRVLEELKGLR